MNFSQGPLLILLGALCFSLLGTIQSFAPEGANSFTITEARMAIGAAGMLVWCLISRKMPTNLRTLQWRPIILVSFCLLAFQWLFFSSVREVGVAVGTVIAIGSTPIWTAVIEKIFFNKLPSRRWYLATLLAVGGILALNWDSFVSGINPLYMALPLLAGLAYACEIIFCKEAMKGAAPESVMMVVMALVALINLPTLFIFSPAWVFTAQGGVVSLALGIVTAALALGLFFSGARTTSASVASTLGMAEPLCAAVWGVAILGEPFHALTAAGIALIMLSIAVLIERQPAAASLPA